MSLKIPNAHAAVLGRYLGGGRLPATQGQEPSGAPAEVNVTLVPDPAADARSAAQSVAITEAITEAVSSKESIPELIKGDVRRPTVAECMEWLKQVQRKADKVHGTWAKS